MLTDFLCIIRTKTLPKITNNYMPIEYLIALVGAQICMTIQWHAHYIKNEVGFWTDTFPSFVVTLLIIYSLIIS